MPPHVESLPYKEGWAMSQIQLTRREFLRGSAAAAGMAMLGGTELFAATRAVAAPVAIGRCRSYEPAAVQARLVELLDQIGGVRRLVRGKTVAVKLNLTGGIGGRFQGARAEETYQVHPAVV